MLVAISTSALKQTQWYEYVLRFALGGTVTVAAYLIGKKFGPEFGGLFLAFPAILAASTTLVEKHERVRKEKKGLQGKYLGRRAAGADAAGAVMGSFGLIAFAWCVWKSLADHNAVAVIAGATAIWTVVSVAIWWMWKQNIFHRVRNRVAGKRQVRLN